MNNDLGAGVVPTGRFKAEREAALWLLAHRRPGLELPEPFGLPIEDGGIAHRQSRFCPARHARRATPESHPPPGALRCRQQAPCQIQADDHGHGSYWVERRGRLIENIPHPGGT